MRTLLTLLLLTTGLTHAADIPFTLEKPSNVSAAIYDAQDGLVRELLHASPMNAGKHSLIWDGLDRDCNTPPAGDYTWKLLQTSGLKATYLMSLGSNFPPGDGWRTACGPGTHHTPFGIAVDASLRDADKLMDPKDVWRDASGNWYAMLEGKGDGYLATSTYGQGHATAWPANLSGSVAFAKWDATGKLVWKVGNKARSIREQRRGELHAPVRVLGEVKGCIGAADRIAQPAEFWTTDGLYVGGLFDHRTDDGLHAAFYAWWRADRNEAHKLENQSQVDYDMVTGGLLFQRANGDVIYCADGWNNLPTYRITGWDKFDRQQGTLHLAAASKPAAVGTGLSARYAAAGTGAAPVREGVDPQIWFGDAPHKKLWPEGVGGEFTATWSGLIEPKFSEEYLLRLYVGQDAENMPEEARLWIDGRLVIDTTKDAKANKDKRATVARFQTEPLPLTAGKQVSVKLEYKKTGSGELHLSWESVSQSIEHVPASALYPDKQP